MIVCVCMYVCMYLEKNARHLEQLLGSEDSLKTVDDLERVFKSFQIDPLDENELPPVAAAPPSSVSLLLDGEEAQGDSDCRHGSCVVYRFYREEVGKDKDSHKVSMRFFKSPAEFMRSLPRPS